MAADDANAPRGDIAGLRTDNGAHTIADATTRHQIADVITRGVVITLPPAPLALYDQRHRLALYHLSNLKRSRVNRRRAHERIGICEGHTSRERSRMTHTHSLAKLVHGVIRGFSI
jgi:hypothetical protein